MDTRSLGFIGLGRMGRGMALNLLRAEGRLCVYDQNADALQPLIQAGAAVAASPAEMASECELIVLCVPFAPEVRDVMFGPAGLARAGRDDLTVLDATTLDRTDVFTIANDAHEAGIRYWDCPVSGMPFRADNGTLTVMFGGTTETFEDARPVMECFGETVIHCGALGSGQAMKAINNIIYDVNIVALCEVLPLAVAMGLDVKAVEQLVTTASSRSFASEYFVPRMLARRFDTDFAMADAYKDIVNIQRMSAEAGATLPVIEAMITSYDAAMAAGLGREPKSAILKIYEDALGVKFEAGTGTD